MTRQDILQILNESKEEIKKRYRAELKGVFGSYARGQQKPGSDVDVLVAWDNNAMFPAWACELKRISCLSDNRRPGHLQRYNAYQLTYAP
ncbi:nucleotidyltransferase domain-containing protein [candidate division TA06 bacterium]|uniref:Nucleotidyltransferase domain-containing protein n=1 Tax=candidate division TA06 bacterium TaxID=2250710 RepID=A0A933MK60_UNCT6|nr:nucleotidyltransferase domain-containing protein [candidate division TA06 bacterium]